MSLTPPPAPVGLLNILFTDGCHASLQVGETPNANGYLILILDEEPPDRAGVASDYFNMALNDGRLLRGASDDWVPPTDEFRWWFAPFRQKDCEDRLISELQLSAKTVAALSRAGVTTISALRNAVDPRLAPLPKMSPKVRREIADAFRHLDLAEKATQRAKLARAERMTELVAALERRLPRCMQALERLDVALAQAEEIEATGLLDRTNASAVLPPCGQPSDPSPADEGNKTVRSAGGRTADRREPRARK